MTMEYSNRDAEYLKRQREISERGVDLVECSDGLYRTLPEKAVFDASETRPEAKS
ncbi:hypothetical protein [Afipia carboxidovorans]|uniref:hypothetical protein n=1 Tax=Afipia carboxidovorans TaxID=40137 RepID=UPI003090DE92|nr:hypothetical protein CRBSH125_35210 [Afipia carboxidovorans]